MYKKLRFLTTMLLLAVCCGTWAEDVYEKYTGTITEGDYIIYYGGYVMKNEVSNDRLAYVSEEANPSSISNPNVSVVWHIAKSGDYYTIYNAAVQKYAASTGAKNKAQLIEDGTDDKALWTVSGNGTYEFVNKQNAANNVNKNLRYNSGYGFACYSTGTGGALTLYKKVEGGDTPSTYTVSYDANGGTGTMTDANSPYNAGATVTVLGNTFTRDNYTFSKWNTAADGSGTDYNEDATFTINTNTTLYAQWTENSGGDSGDTETLTFDFEDSSAHRPSSGSNSFTDNTYTENDVTISLTYADATTTGSPLSGSAHVVGRVAKNTTNSPVVLIGPIDITNWTISKIEYKTKGVGAMSQVFETSLNNSDWTTLKSLSSMPTSTSTETVNNLSITGSQLYLRWTVSVNSSTGSNRDFNLDDVVITYTNSSTPVPSITASDVNIVYDATSGSIAYTINNEPDPAGTMVATTTSDWLTISNGTNFTCSANTAATERAAIVTLTYTYGDNQTTTKDVTVTQAGAPMTIAQVREQGTGSVETKGIVTSCSGKTAYIQDATAAICVYGSELTVGDEVLVEGTLTDYHGLLEITSPTITVLSKNNTTEPEVMTIAEVMASEKQGWLVKIKNAKVTDINGQNTTIAQGENTIIVRDIPSDVTYVEGDIITLTGNIGCYNNAQIANPTDVTVMVTFSENDTEATTITTNANKLVNATLERTLSNTYWSTFSVPFNVTAAQVAEVLGENVGLREFDGSEGTVIKFKATTAITAGHAYLVKPEKAVTNPVFNGVTVVNTTGIADSDDRGYGFVGAVIKKTLKTIDQTTDQMELFLGTDAKFYYPASADVATMKGLRGYFVVPAGTNPSKLSVDFNGIATSINAMNIEGMGDGKIYNLNGQRVNAPQKGLYIVNGKKVIIK